MSAPNDHSERKVYVGKAIMAVKNPPIDRDLEADEQQMASSSAGGKSGKPKREYMRGSTLDDQSIHDHMFDMEDEEEVESDDDDVEICETTQLNEKEEDTIIIVEEEYMDKTKKKMTEEEKKSEGAASQNETAETVDVDNAAKSMPKTQNDAGLSQKSEEEEESIEDEEVRKINKRRLMREAKKRSEEELEHAKRTKTYQSAAEVIEEMQHSAPRDNLKTSLEIIQGSRHFINQKVIITCNDRGRISRIHANLLNIDSDQNMLLSNVVQMYKRKVVPTGEGADKPEVGAKHVVRGTGVVQKHIGNGLWLCQRRTSRLILRGRNVVRIQLDNSPPTAE